MVYLDKQVAIPCFLNSFRTTPCRYYCFYEERREFGLADLFKRFNNNKSGEVCRLILRVWFWGVSFRFFVWRRHICSIFSLALHSTTHHGVQLVLGINHGDNPFALVETGIHNQYTRVCFEGRLPSRCQFQVLSTGQFPILNTIDRQPPPSST